jgi:hypothetical protein
MKAWKTLNIIALMTFYSTQGFSQVDTAQLIIREAIDNLNRGLSGVLLIRDSLPENPKTVKFFKDVNKFDYQLNKFSDLLRQTNWDIRSSNTMVAELENYKILLDSIKKSPTSAMSEKYVLFLNSDLAIKLNNKFASDNQSKDPPDMVRVKIIVFDGKNRELTDVRGFLRPEICYDPANIQEFSPTNQAIKQVLPGRKYVWIVRNGRQVGEKVEPVTKPDDGNLVTITFLIENAK